MINTADAKWVGPPAAMRLQEYDCLRTLLREVRPKNTLEIGMAHGGSTIVICEELRNSGGGRHTAIDPFQTSCDGWDSRGVHAVEAAGLADLFELHEDFDYLALPALIKQKRQFDFILIDGWHSFDYTMINLFYADLLLRCDGVLAIHDSDWPAVFKACRFLETHKPYDRLSPPQSEHTVNVVRRLRRRLGQFLAGPRHLRAMKSRRKVWYSLSAYRKRENYQVPDDFFAKF